MLVAPLMHSFLQTGAAFNIDKNELHKEGISASVVGIWKFIRKYEDHGTTQSLPRSGRPSLVTPRVEAAIEARMEEWNHCLTASYPLGIKGLWSLSTIQRNRTKMGWTFQGSAYCQLIRDANKEKRLEWAEENLTAASKDRFTDVVWTDEASIRLESHRRHCVRKAGCQPWPKPRCVCKFPY